jgi:hypothetical protein
LQLAVSATKIFPYLSAAIPLGKENLAEIPAPSISPHCPEPAIVVTNPKEVIFRIL